MGSMVFLLVLFMVVGVLASLVKKRQSHSSRELSYEIRQDLFSPAERSFLGVLEQTVAGRYRIFGKVRLGDLIQPARGYSRSQRFGAWNRINQKHVDFVLCHPETLATVAAVELDDSSHQRKDRRERDDFVDQALKSAGIPLVRFAARKGYAVAEMQAQLEVALFPEGGYRAAEDFSLDGPGEEKFLDAADEARAEQRENKAAPSLEAEVTTDSEEMICSACNSPMVKRLAKKGSNAGKWFWACSAFPKCRKVVGIE